MVPPAPAQHPRLPQTEAAVGRRDSVVLFGLVPLSPLHRQTSQPSKVEPTIAKLGIVQPPATVQSTDALNLGARVPDKLAVLKPRSNTTAADSNGTVVLRTHKFSISQVIQVIQDLVKMLFAPIRPYWSMGKGMSGVQQGRG